MFLTFEGIEGSGKTTQIGHVKRFLAAGGRSCIVTREPGGTDIGNQIRALLLDPATRGLDPIAELLLYMADRAQHLAETIRPHLAMGKAVICDRYVDATIVYQGYARGLCTDTISELHRSLFADLKPDLTFLLDLPPSMGLDRAWRQIDDGRRTPIETRFESEALDFHERVRQGYLSLARQEPGRIRCIDASLSRQAVTDRIVDELTAYLARRPETSAPTPAETRPGHSKEPHPR